MYFSLLQCVTLALPLVSAVRLHPRDTKASTSNAVCASHPRLGTSSDSIAALLKSGGNVTSAVNAALNNILPSKIDSESLLNSTLSKIRRQVTDVQALSITFAGLLQAIVANTAPTNITAELAQVAATIGTINTTTSVITVLAEALLNGLATTDLTQNVLAGSSLSTINSYNNVNPVPASRIYPKKQGNDAPYSVPEAQLRAAIYIPPTFTYGSSNKRPILFVPGTGSFGGINYASNLGKLIGNDARFNPVYLNVPGAMLNDTQINSEYIAYATNYLSAITGNSTRLGVIAWSQGGEDVQWVFQYWPSTRRVVEDFIPVSEDLHGTTLAYLLDPAFPSVIPNPPSVIQQQYDSNYTVTLRVGGGGSPYVNSTSLWSITDEIVQPQFTPYASAAFFTQDLPGTVSTASVCPLGNRTTVAYTNVQVQTVCAGRPAGGFYTHEGMLAHPLTYALAIDALTNPGPGRIDRINLNTVCNQLIAPGLTAADFAATEGLIVLSFVNLLLYPQKVLVEPPVKSYATAANAACARSSK